VTVDTVSELLVRIAKSYIEIPSNLIPLQKDRMRAFAERHLAGLVY
jgi:hypothetical protein